MIEESITVTAEEPSAEAQSQDGDVASMEHPEEVIHGAADESKRQKAAAASTDAPAPQQSQQGYINYFFSVQPHCPQALPCNALLAGEGARSDRGW